MRSVPPPEADDATPAGAPATAKRRIVRADERAVVADRIRVAVTGKVLRRNVGGNTTYAQTLYRHLAGLGVAARILVAPGDRRGGALRALAYAAEEGIVWPRTECRRADLLHFPADTGALVRAPVPIVATVHGVPVLNIPGFRRALWQRSWHARVARLTRLADAVITVSENSAREIEHAFGVPEHRLHVIPNGVDHDRFHTDGSADAAMLAPLRLPERFILYIGNLDPRKNIPALVEAAGGPEMARLGVPLVVAGGSFLGAEPTERLLASAPQVRYLGQVPPTLVAPLMRAAAVFVFPSSHEGFGLPVLEAMACGTPVIASDRGALPEVTGDAAYPLTDLCAKSIATALDEILTDERLAADLRARGLANARRFTWAEAARRHRDLFAHLLTGRSR